MAGMSCFNSLAGMVGLPTNRQKAITEGVREFQFPDGNGGASDALELRALGKHALVSIP